MRLGIVTGGASLGRIEFYLDRKFSTLTTRASGDGQTQLLPGGDEYDGWLIGEDVVNAESTLFLVPPWFLALALCHIPFLIRVPMTVCPAGRDFFMHSIDT